MEHLLNFFKMVSLGAKWREASKWFFSLKEKKKCRKSAAFDFQALQLLQKIEVV